jgi:protein SCO1/2
MKNQTIWSFVSMKLSLPKIIFLLIVLGISSVFYVLVLRQQQQYYVTHYVKIHGAYLLKPIEINAFKLTDMYGKQFTLKNLKGHWSMIYFGFTQCDVICPTMMAMLNKMYAKLRTTLPPIDMPQVVFITIDPERDSPKSIYNYVVLFNSQFIGARGSQNDIMALEKQLHIVVNKIQSNAVNNYSLDHSTDILLVNPNGKIQAYFTYPQDTDALVNDYRLILAQRKREKR